MFQYLLFDLDGTLTDPKIGITKSVQYALQAQGIDEPNLDKLEPFIGPPLKDSFMEFYAMDEVHALQAVDKYRERFTDIGIFENELIPGIPQMLAHARAAGAKIAIASSKPTVLVERILVHFEIDQYFDVVVGSELDGSRSKKEEVVQEALNQLLPIELHETSLSKEALLARKSQIAMIGDRKFDIEGAIAHTLTGVGVTFGYAGEGELERAGADYIAESVPELEDILLG